MKVNHFTITQTKTETLYSADFILPRPLRGRKQRLALYLNRLLHPSLWKEKRSETYTLWFSLPIDLPQSPNFQDAFFLIATVMSQAMNQDLEFEGAVSREIVSKVQKLEEYFRFEKPPRHTQITIKEITENHYEKKGTAQFFSLGVDSFYTLLCHDVPSRPGRTLVFVEGCDIPLNKEAFLKVVHNNFQDVVKKTKTKGVTVRTNVKDLSEKIINWPQFHTTALAAIGTLLPFDTIFISGESFDWPDWGLRFGVDELFSSSYQKFQLVAHNTTRDTKIAALKKSPLLKTFLNHVRVCWKNVEQENVKYNCSACQKCLRTQLTFQALDMHETPTFQPYALQDLADVEIVGHVRNEWTILYMMLKKQKNVDPQLIHTLEQVLRKPIKV